ncbi:MAG: succinate--CoA ligase subunit beta [Gloeocapsa sp. DLM2.Bin57]|nr:MAG: succinate--CoA ligase subunit beta [Gloeocapsa sp. DLM2.Bin57]
MVDLLEYQAKELFKQVGIPTLPSQVIAEPRELRQLEIPYPIVVKSQVRASGRGKAGGVRFAQNTIDAIAAASIIFNLPILGQFPEVVLAEARYNVQQELFLGIVLDYQRNCPVLLGSIQGGVNLDILLANLQVIPLEGDFFPYHGRKLCRQMGLTGNLIEEVSEIVTKMYTLFISKDLDLIEINPLGISPEGEVMALDGRISANDAGIQRHPKLKGLIESEIQPLLWLHSQPKSAKIGIICNSVDLGMATLDLITPSEFSVGCLVIKDNLDDLKQGLKEWESIPEVEVILINILKNQDYSELVVGVIADYLQSLYIPKIKSDERYERPTGIINRHKVQIQPQIKPPTLVLRLLTQDFEPWQKLLTGLPVYWSEDLESAVTQTISLTQGAKDELADLGSDFSTRT